MPYPQDADGDALRKVAAHGADMSRPMIIDFSVDASNEEVATSVASLVTSRGYDPKIYHDDESGNWSVYCSRSMLATYEGVVAAQDELNALLQSLGAVCDGWGTFGNKSG